MELNHKDNVSYIGVCYSPNTSDWFLITGESETEVKEDMAQEVINVEKSFILKVKLPPTDEAERIEDKIKVVEANP